jgi:ABC-type bacteriocin/lantibiotic exporter with double-glycine peptidase domain
MNSIILPVNHIRQLKNGECVAACAAMILTYIGIKVNYFQLLKLLRVTEIGTAFYHIRELEKVGVIVVYKQGTLGEVHDHLSNNRPCIAAVKTKELPYFVEDSDHAVVIVGLDEQFVYLNDPAMPNAPQQVSHGNFLLAWIERDEMYATIIKRN